MKRSTLTFILLIILLPLSNKVSGQESDSIVSLSIEGIGTQETAYLDTLRLGTLPVKNAQVSKGSYRLKIISVDTRSWETENIEIPLQLISDTTLTINFDHYYSFNSNPFNSEVFNNETWLGLTPLRMYFEKPLSGKIVFRKKDHKEKTLFLTDSTGRNINVSLVPLGIKSLDDLVYKNRQTNFKSKRNFLAIGSFGLGVLASAYTTVHYKTIANDAYDRYLDNGDPQELAVSNNNDLYSTVSLVFMQAAVAGLIYFLFIDR